MTITTSLRWLIGVTGVALWLVAIPNVASAQSPERVYEGKPESFWINLLSDPQSRDFQISWRNLGTNDVPILLKALEETEGPRAAIIRTNAAKILSSRADAKTLLSIQSKTSDPQVKMWILNGLIFNGERAVTVAMVEALRHKNPQIRRTAALGLGLTEREKIPEQLPALVKCLRDSDPDVRCQAAQILCQYWPYLPGQDQGVVADTAAAEIKRGTSDADPVVKNAAAKAVLEGNSQSILEKYAPELALALAELHGTPWTVTLKVVDEACKPIEAAQVSVTYYVPAEPGGDPWSSWREIKGATDGGGIFKAAHKDNSFQLGFSAKKRGYYSTHGGHEFYFKGTYDEQKMASNRNPNVTLVLKKIIHPVPMYVNWLVIHEKKRPPLEQPIGFDLTVGDWVRPRGEGTNTQMLFTWRESKETKGKWNGELLISFPNPGDGILEFYLPGSLGNERSEGSVGSELRSPQEAPEAGYQPALLKSYGGTNAYDHLHKNYFLRVSTVLDANGRVKSAHYGKIYGDFESAITTYLNPEPNSRSLEFDKEHNLGRAPKVHLRY